MARDEKFGAAKKLIDAFAAQLLALNDGKEIPAHWVIHLKKALMPKPGKAGRKINPAQVADVVRLLTLAGEKVEQPRTKHHNPALYKDCIAEETGASRKTVERIMVERGKFARIIERIMAGEGKYSPEADALSPDMCKAIAHGVAEVIGPQIMAELEAEDRAIQQREARRRNLKKRTSQ